MNLEKLIAVSGLPGLYRMAANRNNGLILEDLTTGKKKFASARKHQFTPLESIAIFTDDGDSTELKNVFQSMLSKQDSLPVAKANAGPDELHEYFSTILPNYDRDRVYTSDIKKVIKWFTFLKDRELLNTSEEATSDEEE